MGRNNRRIGSLPARECATDRCRRTTRSASGYCHQHSDQQFDTAPPASNIPSPSISSVAKKGKEFYDSSKDYFDVIPAVAILSTKGPVGVAAAAVIGTAMITDATVKGLETAQEVLDKSDPPNRVGKALHTDIGRGFFSRLSDAWNNRSPYPVSEDERNIILRHRDDLKEKLDRSNAADLHNGMAALLNRMSAQSKRDPLDRIDERINAAERIIQSPTSTAEHKRQQRIEQRLLRELRRDLSNGRSS